MALLTSARVEKAPSTEKFDPPVSFTIVVRVERLSGAKLAERKITRRFILPHVTVRDVVEAEVFGRFFLPDARRRRGCVVITLSGSEGGVSSSQIAAALYAAHGFPALALAYFRAPSKKGELIEIPVETVQHAIEWVSRELPASRVVLSGASKGAELALLAASLIPEVRGVIAYAPTSVVWPGIASNGKTVPQSSWTWRGTPVEFVPHVPVPEFTQQFSHAPPYALRPLYEASLRDASAVARAAIHVERINGPVLLISGRDDQMIPSDAMAESVMARLRNSGHRYPDKHLSYQAAGHQIGIPFLPAAPRTSAVPFASGGTRAGYAEADAKSWVIVLGYLAPIAVP